MRYKKKNTIIIEIMNKFVVLINFDLQSIIL